MSSFVQLTQPDGQTVWVAAQWVTKVTATLPGEYPVNAKSLISMGQSVQAVTEQPIDVVNLLSSALYVDSN